MKAEQEDFDPARRSIAESTSGEKCERCLQVHITDITYKGSGVALLLSKCEGVFPQPF